MSRDTDFFLGYMVNKVAFISKSSFFFEIVSKYCSLLHVILLGNAAHKTVSIVQLQYEFKSPIEVRRLFNGVQIKIRNLYKLDYTCLLFMVMVEPSGPIFSPTKKVPTNYA